jgi:hypothetical protein
MVTGCAPFFLLGLLGVALGSWFFGSHYMARMTGLAILTIFLTYFALLNWTAQSNIKNRKAGDDPKTSQESGDPHAEAGDEIPFTEEDRREWAHYLQTEGRILWLCVALLTLVLIILFFRN